MASRKSYLLRLPPELLDELNRWAKDELRSVNAQIEYLLREAVRQRRKRTFAAGDDTAEDDTAGDDRDEASEPHA
ncbi:MAG: type II toxin-antitoxin system antitoxin [Planctomycetota bacterium]|jgi:hypothetical protein